MVDDPGRGGRAALRKIKDANIAVVRNDCVGDDEADRIGDRLDQDAVSGGGPGAGEIPHDRVGDLSLIHIFFWNDGTNSVQTYCGLEIVIITMKPNNCLLYTSRCV